MSESLTAKSKFEMNNFDGPLLPPPIEFRLNPESFKTAPF